MYFYYFCYGEREADTDLFSSVVHHSIGQQISTKAQTTKQSGRGLRMVCHHRKIVSLGRGRRSNPRHERLCAEKEQEEVRNGEYYCFV